MFIFILFLTFALVIYGETLKKKQVHNESENLLDLLLMGRQLTLPLFVATLVATWYGGIFGVTQIAFEKGIYNFITQGVFWYVTYLIFAFCLVHRIRRYEAVTLPDMVGRMFGPKSAKISAVFNLINVLPVAYVISVGIFLQFLIPASLLTNMIIGTVLVILYSLFGGFRAVVFSELVQFFVMCVGVLLVLLFSFWVVGSPMVLWEKLPRQHFSLTGGHSILSTMVWGFIALTTLVDPGFYQRCFAAKSTAIAKKGILISTFIWFCFDICTTMGAMYARLVIPEADSANSYMTYTLQLLPAGLRGFALAGILATILSTLDAYLFIAGTTLSHDIFSGKKQTRFTYYIGVTCAAIVTIALANSFEGSIRSVWKTMGSYSASCLLWPILYGHFRPHKLDPEFKDQQFLWSCLCGAVAITGWQFFPRENWGFFGQLDELYIGVLASSVTLLSYPIFYRKFLRPSTLN